MNNAEIAAKLVDAMYWQLSGMRGIVSGSDPLLMEGLNALNVIADELRTASQPASEPQQDAEQATRCSLCGELQFQTPSGVCCKNGHGGAEQEKTFRVGHGNVQTQQRAAEMQAWADLSMQSKKRFSEQESANG